MSYLVILGTILALGAWVVYSIRRGTRLEIEKASLEISKKAHEAKIAAMNAEYLRAEKERRDLEETPTDPSIDPGTFLSPKPPGDYN